MTAAIDACSEENSCDTGGILISFGTVTDLPPGSSQSPSPSRGAEETPFVVNLVTDQGVTVGSVSLPATITNSGGQLQANFVAVNSTSLLPNPGGVGAVILDLSLTDSNGEAVTQLEEPIEICFDAPNNKKGKGGSLCLGFFDVKKNRWQCQDPCLTQQNGTFCGQTDHLTSFALLLQGLGNTDPCASDSSGRVLVWLSLAFVCVAIIAVLVGVVIIEIRHRAIVHRRNQSFSKLGKLTYST